MNERTHRPEELLAHGPFVRRLARSLVRDAHQAEDVAQSALAAGLEGAPRGAGLRSWLAAVTARIAAKEQRGDERRAERERRAARPEATDSVAELVAREAARRRVIEALLALEEPYRGTLVLRFYEGLPPRRIAERMGVPVETVRTRVKRGLGILRARLDRELDGGRAAWSALLVPLAAAPPGLLTTEAARELALEVLAMSTKAKVVSVACALVAVGLVVVVQEAGLRGRPRVAEQQPVLAVAQKETASMPQRAVEPLAPPSTPDEARVAAESVVAGEAPDEEERFGTLELRVVGAADGAPRPGEWLRVDVPRIADGMLRSFELRTDSAGRARVERLPAGQLHILPLRGLLERAELAPGATLGLTVELARGFDVHGTVVDGDGAPVEGADIWLSQPSSRDWWARVVATSDAEGAFRVPELTGSRMLGARSKRHTPSQSSYARTSESGRPMKLVLGGPSGSVEGRVWLPDGEAAPGTLVRVGSRGVESLFESIPGGVTPPYADTLTDEEGRFALAGIPPGERPVAVRACDHATWLGSTLVDEGRAARIEMTLSPGATLEGVVRDAGGVPQPDVEVVDLDHPRGKLKRAARTGPDGSFRLEHAGPGELRLRADGGDRGRAETVLHALPGQVLAWDPVLSTGLELHGRVVDEHGTPHEGPLRASLVSFRGGLEDADVHRASKVLDEDGRFAFVNLRDREHRLEISALYSMQPLLVRTVRPRGGELVLRVDRHLLPSVVIAGGVRGPGGTPAQGAQVLLSRHHGAFERLELDSTTGRFETRQLTPGMWMLTVRDDAGPELRFGPRELGPGERWDLGTIELGATGSMLARWRRAEGIPGEAPRLVLRHAGERSRSRLDIEKDSARAEGLAPGSYALQVSGEGIASALHPFEVLAGGETFVDLLLAPGFPRRIRVELAERDRAQHFVRLEIVRPNGVVVVSDSLGHFRGQPLEREYHLAPGSYEVVARLAEGDRRSDRVTMEVTAEIAAAAQEVVIRID